MKKARNLGPLVNMVFLRVAAEPNRESKMAHMIFHSRYHASNMPFSYAYCNSLLKNFTETTTDFDLVGYFYSQIYILILYRFFVF